MPVVIFYIYLKNNVGVYINSWIYKYLKFDAFYLEGKQYFVIYKKCNRGQQ